MTATIRNHLPVIATDSGPMYVDTDGTVGLALILPGDRTIEMSHDEAARLARELDTEHHLDPAAPHPEQYQEAGRHGQDELEKALSRIKTEAMGIVNAITSGAGATDDEVGVVATAFLELLEAADSASGTLRDISIGDVGYYG